MQSAGELGLASLLTFISECVFCISDSLFFFSFFLFACFLSVVLGSVVSTGASD